MNGKRAIKKNEANWPVKKSIRVVKDAKADQTYSEEKTGLFGALGYDEESEEVENARLEAAYWYAEQDKKEEILCLFCSAPVTTASRPISGGTYWIHKDGYEECAPTYASPNLQPQWERHRQRKIKEQGA